LAAIIAGIMVVYLVLIITTLLPMPKISFMNESPVHFIAQIIIFLLLLAAIGFWEND